jgi:maleate cis-trans isomerase
VNFGVTFRNVHLAPLWIAEDRGIFKKHGVDIKQANISGGTQGAQMTVSGGVDVSYDDPISGIVATAGGALTEVMNPGLFNDLQSALKIPVTTALSASVAALRKYSAQRVLLLTPFESQLNRMIEAYLADAGFSAVAPRAFGNIGEADRLDPDEVFDLTKEALTETGRVDAIYFQGAVLDPLKVLDKIEKDLETIGIASNPAMLSHILSQLGCKAVIPGHGKLPAQ